MYILQSFLALLAFLWRQLLRLFCPFEYAPSSQHDADEQDGFDPIPEAEAKADADNKKIDEESTPFNSSSSQRRMRAHNYTYHGNSGPNESGTGNNSTNNSSSSLTEDFSDFTLLHSTPVLRLCAFYFLGYLIIAVFCFSFVFEKQWSIIDSLYFAIALFTTIGYGDLQPTNDGTRLFLIWFSLYGVVILGIFLGVVGYTLAEMQRKTVEQMYMGSTKATLTALIRTDDDHNDDHEQQQEEEKQQQESPSSRSKNGVQNQNKCSTNTAREKQDTKQRGDSPPLVQDVMNLIWLECPILILIFIMALCVGRIEGWTIVQSVYFAVISMSTVGFGDVAPEHQGTRLFVVFFIPIAVAVFGELVARIASLYINNQMRRLEKQFLQRSITMLDFQRMDTDQDGMVSMDEFLAFMLVALQKVDRQTIDDIRHLFQSLDVTQDGFIGKEDLILLTQNHQGWANLRSFREYQHQ